MKTFRKFILTRLYEKEVKLKDVNMSDPCDVVFEKSIFHAVSKEQDTDVEADIWNAVKGWIEGSDDYNKIMPYYKKLIQCKGAYKALNPNVTTIYRGLVIPISQALKMISINKATSKSGAEISGGGLKLTGHPVVYTPQAAIESWTSKLSAATQFATGEKDTGGLEGWEGIGDFKEKMSDIAGYMKTLDRHLQNLKKAKSKEDASIIQSYIDEFDNTLKQDIIYLSLYVVGKDNSIPIVYSAPIDDNFVMNPTFSNEILKVVLQMSDEYEITRIGKTPIKGMVYFPKDLLVAIDMMTELNTKLKAEGYTYQIKSPLLPKK